MATILAKLLDGELSHEDIFDIVQSVENKDIEIKNGKQRIDNLAELSPFLINYLREKTAHHLTPRQTAVLSPKKTPVFQERTKRNSASPARETPHHGIKNSSKGNLFPLQKTPTSSPVTPLSQNRRERLQERQSSPNSSPLLRRKSPKPQGHQGSRVSPLVIQKKLSIDDPEDFPPMGAAVTPENKKVTPSRRITPIPIQSDGNKGKASTPFSSSLCIESHESSSSLQEERKMLKLIKSKKKNKEDTQWGERMSPSFHVGVRSPPLVLGDFIVSPNSRSHSPKNSAMADACQQGHTAINQSTWSTARTCKDVNENNSPLASSSDGLKVTHSEDAIKSTAQAVQVKKDKIGFQDKINVLAKVYSNCITGNLVPNLTAELYFVVQLLTARGTPSELKHEENHESNMTEQNVLDSIHNCVYFAVEVLQNIQSLILLLDKETLHLLADNPRIAEFSPSLKDTFLKQSKTSASPVKVSGLSNFIKSPLGGVPFSVERDNRQNFPTDRAFHNFRKQRDVFYELVREWEDCHSRAGWNLEECMGHRIRALVNQKPELANYSHFARLFKCQLLQMCEDERSDFHASGSFGNLQKSNPEKFQRLQERFVTPLSSCGPCPPPSFTNVQEFFKRFIVCAASPSFNQHLMDLLIVTVTELNDTEFPMAEIKEGMEKDVSLQHQELRQEFASCLMKIRVLAKFLGFLTFQPYYGSGISSQPVVRTALQIRNKIPALFDILRYLKTAWRKKRLVMTVPWAVQYLSMMDPLGPLLDYFSEVLHWLLRTYRQMAPMQHVDYSRLLLVSCLGWLFEIPVIPASFFFKASTELKLSDDSDDYSTKELDQQVNLDTSGLVDQDILYSCCPYLGEIRYVLVEAAAGLTSRAGPVKKITPICADEPARISSSHKQLQLQLEESFFRIQPDYLKRLSDFTLERLSSNIISHIKGHIVPSLLENGAQRIQRFLNSEFSSNGNSDQAKEKCRPSILKIIHSVTDDAVKRAMEVAETCRTKCVSSFETLCPQEMNPKVIMTAAKITGRLIKEKTTDWINTSLPNVMEEELFAQFNKIVNSILYVKSTEEREKLGNDRTQVDCSAKSSMVSSETNSTDTTITSVCKERKSTVSFQIKALQSVLSDQFKLLATKSSNGMSLETAEAVIAVENNLSKEGEKQWYVKDLMLVGQITVELAFVLVCRTSHHVAFRTTNSTEGDKGILGMLLHLWSRLQERRAPAPFQHLLTAPHVQLITRTDNSQVIWEAVQQFCLVLIENGLTCIDEVQQWYLGALSSCTDEGSAVEVGKACCYLVSAHYETTVKRGATDGSHKSPNSADFCLLLSTIRQRFADNASIMSLLRKCVQIIPGVIVIVDDSSEHQSPHS